MTFDGTAGGTMRDLDESTRALVRLAAMISAGSEREITEAITRTPGVIPPEWVEELILQTYLFAGFPRGLNAMRAWRRVTPEPAA